MAEFRVGDAIWKNKDVDQPINIIEDLGTGPDGRHYVKIEGSSSGIPLDEIEYKPKVKTTPLGKPKTTGSKDLTPSVRASNENYLSNAKKVFSEADDLGAGAAKGIPEWAPKAGLIVGGVIAAGTVVGIGLSIHNKVRERKQTREQERNNKRRQEEFGNFDKDVYYNALDQLNGLPQQLYSNRNGHSNTWGGKKY